MTIQFLTVSIFALLLTSTLGAISTTTDLSTDSSSSNLKIWIRKLECYGQPYPATKLLECSVQNFRDINRPQVISIVLETLEPQQRVFVSFGLFVQHKRLRSSLYGTTVDLCKVIEDGTNGSNKVSELVLNLARRNFPQVVKPCPYEGVVNASGIVMGASMVLPYLLRGNYRCDVRIYNRRNQTLLAWRTDFEMR